MSLRRKEPASTAASGNDGAASAAAARPSPFETGTGFSVTSSGAIGFSEEIEKSLEAMHMGTQLSTEATPPQQSRTAATAASTISCNRDAYAQIHVTCASVQQQQQLPLAGEVEGDPAVAGHTEEGAPAHLFPTASGATVLPCSLGVMATSGLAPNDDDPRSIAEKTFKLLKADQYFKDAMHVQDLTRKVGVVF